MKCFEMIKTQCLACFTDYQVINIFEMLTVHSGLKWEIMSRNQAEWKTACSRALYLEDRERTD